MIIEMLNKNCKQVFADMANKQGEYAYTRRTGEN